MERACILGLMILLLNSPAHAVIIPWQDSNIPSALAPFQNNPALAAELIGQETLIYGQVPQSIRIPYAKGAANYNQVRFNSAAVVLPVPEAQIKQTLSRYQQYVGLFPTLTKATLLEQSGNISQMKYHIQVPIPLPILRFNEDVVMQHQLADHSMSTLIIDSPIQYGVGKFEWFALDDSHTLVTLTQWGDLDKPKGFLVSTVLKALPEAKQGIPQGFNTFVFESLIKRYAPDKNLPLYTPRQLPQKALSAAQLQLVQQINTQSGSPVMFIYRPVKLPYRHGNETMQFVSTYATLNAPLEKASTLLSTPQSYQKIFRQVSKVETKPLADKTGVEAAITFKIGLGVISIPYRINLRYFQEPMNSVIYQANGGDIEFMQGRMQFETLGKQQTRLIMTSSAKIGDNAPFLLKLSKALPYADLLPSVGGAPVLISKTNEYLKK